MVDRWALVFRSLCINSSYFRVVQALGKEKVRTREEQQAELRVTVLRVMVLHKEVKELQQKLGTPWHKKVEGARKELGFRCLPSGGFSSSELGRNKSPGL